MHKGRNTRLRPGISLPKGVRNRLLDLARAPSLGMIVALGLVGLGWLFAWMLGGAAHGQEHFTYRIELFSESWIGIAMQSCAVFLIVLHLLHRSARGGTPERLQGIWTHTVLGCLGLASLALAKAITWQAMEQGGASGLYVRISHDLGRPYMWISLVIGVTSLSVYAASELESAFGVITRPRWAPDLSWSRSAGILLALVFWLSIINGLSHFVVGRALWVQALESAEGMALANACIFSDGLSGCLYARVAC